MKELIEIEKELNEIAKSLSGKKTFKFVHELEIIAKSFLSPYYLRQVEIFDNVIKRVQKRFPNSSISYSIGGYFEVVINLIEPTSDVSEHIFLKCKKTLDRRELLSYDPKEMEDMIIEHIRDSFRSGTEWEISNSGTLENLPRIQT